jgi:hypothetical protein
MSKKDSDARFPISAKRCHQRSRCYRRHRCGLFRRTGLKDGSHCDPGAFLPFFAGAAADSVLPLRASRFVDRPLSSYAEAPELNREEIAARLRSRIKDPNVAHAAPGASWRRPAELRRLFQWVLDASDREISIFRLWALKAGTTVCWPKRTDGNPACRSLWTRLGTSAILAEEGIESDELEDALESCPTRRWSCPALVGVLRGPWVKTVARGRRGVVHDFDPPAAAPSRSAASSAPGRQLSVSRWAGRRTNLLRPSPLGAQRRPSWLDAGALLTEARPKPSAATRIREGAWHGHSD